MWLTAVTSPFGTLAPTGQRCDDVDVEPLGRALGVLGERGLGYEIGGTEGPMSERLLRMMLSSAVALLNDMLGSKARRCEPRSRASPHGGRTGSAFRSEPPVDLRGHYPPDYGKPGG